MKFFSTQELSNMKGTSSSYIRLKVNKAKKNNYDFIFLKGKKFFFRKRFIGKGYEFFEASFYDLDKKSCEISFKNSSQINPKFEINIIINVNGIKVK